MEEGRRAERIQHLTTDDDLISDVSETGICLKVNEAVSQSSLLSIELSSSQNTIIVKARVVYSKPAGKTGFNIGLQYVDLIEKQKEVIFDMVDSFSKGVPIRAKIVKP